MFGIGIDQANAKIDNIPNAQNFGRWFYDWGWQTGSRPGLEYLACIGAWGESSWAEIGMVASHVENNPKLYPNGSAFIVGNEIGTWDDNARTARRYARDFVHWARTLKEINPTYRIGLGALLTIHMYLPSTTFTCRRYGGLEYIGQILYWLQQREVKLLPDFFGMHGYTPCYGGWDDVQAFINQVITYRNFLDSHGFKNKELWMPEFGPLHPYDVSPNHVSDYMRQVVTWLKASGKVTRWAWFALNPEKPIYRHLALLYNQVTTPLGRVYQELQ